ncbi:MAG: hypothetical protein K2H84_00845 [Paramuribaculum sp.]|nr:hypothetical protein [Paramuribaculum sp.]
MKNFTFSLKWHTILSEYPAEIRGEIYFAVIEYAATGKIVEMQPLARMAFGFIKHEIDERARKREARKAKKEQAKEGVDTSEKARKDEQSKYGQDSLVELWADNSKVKNGGFKSGNNIGAKSHRSVHSRSSRDIFTGTGI